MAKLVTLFGGAGFLGRYVAQELLSAGARVRVAERDPKRAFFVKPLGGLGQTQFVAADVTNAENARRAAQGSDVVINLVGILKGDFGKVHVEGARNAAAAAKAAGATSFVQISAIGADPEAASAYGRSKGEGDAAVKEAFPGATIVRPSILFGAEDQFLNRFAAMAQIMPVLPIVRPTVKFQPVWVGDVARAIAAVALDPASHAGKTYELGGPEVLTMEALMQWLMRAIGRNRALLPLPDAASAMIANFGWLPGAPLTRDQWLMLQKDNVVSAGAEGFEALGLAPSPLAALAPAWLVSYRRHGRFGTRSAV
jgi:NADH dehydrogenase